jgi:hypothetical protein
MKLLKYFLILIGYTFISVTTAFLMALIAKLIVRAAQFGWGLLAVMFLLASSIQGPATLVQFPIKQMSGGANYTKPFTITAVASSLTDNTNIFIGSVIPVTPTGGTNPIVNLTPNNYVVTFPDSRTPWRIQVTNSASLLDALQLTQGTLPTFNYVPPSSGSGSTNGISYIFRNTNTLAGTITTNGNVVWLGTNLPSTVLLNRTAQSGSVALGEGAQASHANAFVWADGGNRNSVDDQTALIYASKGVYLSTAAGAFAVNDNQSGRLTWQGNDLQTNVFFKIFNTNLPAGMVAASGESLGVGTNLPPVVTPDDSGFYITNSTFYNRGVLKSGRIVLLETNLHLSYTENTTNNTRIILGSVPNFMSGEILLMDWGTNDSPINIHTWPSIQRSIDNGSTWAVKPTDQPALVSVFIPESGCSISNLVVYGYENIATSGATNDLAGQYLFVDMATGESRSVVNVAGAQAMIDASIRNWSLNPAVSPVDLNGNNLQFSPYWWTTLGADSSLTFNFNGLPAFSFTPQLIGSGAQLLISAFSKTTTNLQFTVASAATNAPTLYFSPTIENPVWLPQTVITNWADGSNWHVWLALKTNAMGYFRATSITNGNSQEAVFYITASALKLNGITIPTNAPAAQTNWPASAITNAPWLTTSPAHEYIEYMGSAANATIPAGLSVSTSFVYNDSGLTAEPRSRFALSPGIVTNIEFTLSAAAGTLTNTLTLWCYSNGVPITQLRGVCQIVGTSGTLNYYANSGTGASPWIGGTNLFSIGISNAHGVSANLMYPQIRVKVLR